MSIQAQLIKIYLDFINNYLTIDRIAEDYGMSTDNMSKILLLGRKFHEENAGWYSQFGKLKYDVK